MKVSEYIRRKNDIIEKATGIVLVPEDQIIDIEPMELSTIVDADACPYCQVFMECEGCPMRLAGNGCGDYDDSTYRQVTKKLGHIVFSSVGEEIENLVHEYNESNGF